MQRIVNKQEQASKKIKIYDENFGQEKQFCYLGLTS